MAMPTFSSDVIFTNKPDRGENNHSFTREISAYPELGVGISLLAVNCALPSYQAVQAVNRKDARMKSAARMPCRKENHQRREVRDNGGKNRLFHGCQIKTQRSGLAFPSMVK
jgi:hypothetical protein